MLAEEAAAGGEWVGVVGSEASWAVGVVVVEGLATVRAALPGGLAAALEGVTLAFVGAAAVATVGAGRHQRAHLSMTTQRCQGSVYASGRLLKECYQIHTRVYQISYKGTDLSVS